VKVIVTPDHFLCICSAAANFMEILLIESRLASGPAGAIIKNMCKLLHFARFLVQNVVFLVVFLNITRKKIQEFGCYNVLWKDKKHGYLSRLLQKITIVRFLDKI